MLDFLFGKQFAIYIRDEAVQVMQLKGDTEKPQVLALGERKLSAGIVVSGEVLKEKELAENIKQLLADTKPAIEGEKCVLALPETQTYEYVLHLSKDLSGDDLEKAISDKIAEYIPIPFTELKYDYQTYEAEEAQVIFVVAIRRLIIAQYYEVLNNFAGLKPTSFEPESASLLRNLPLKFDEKHKFILVYAGEKSINWFAFSEGFICDSNSIEVDQEVYSTLLIDDLKKSIKHFKEQTNQSLTSIIIAGKKEKINRLELEIKESIQLPLVKIENTKLQKENYEVIGGAALKAFGIEGKLEVDLMKKK